MTELQMIIALSILSPISILAFIFIFIVLDKNKDYKKTITKLKKQLKSNTEIGDKGTYRIWLNGHNYDLPIIISNISNSNNNVQFKFDRDKMSINFHFNNSLINELNKIEFKWHDIDDNKIYYNKKDSNFELSEENAETLSTFIKIAELDEIIEDTVLKRLKIK